MKKKSKKSSEKELKFNQLIKSIFTPIHDLRKQSYFEIATSAFLYLFLSSFALIISKNAYADITATKLYTLIAMFGLWLILLIVGFVDKIKEKQVNLAYFKGAVRNVSVTDIALISYTLIAFISAIFSEYRYSAFMGVKARNEGFLIQLLYISTFFILSRTYVNKWELKIFAAASIPVSLLGIMQINGYYVGAITYDITRYGRSFISTIGNIDVVSTYLVVPIILFTVMYCQSKEKFWRFLYMAAAGFAFYLVILMKVRSGFVGMIGSVGLMFPFIAKDRISASRIFQMFSLLAFLVYLEGQIAGIGTRDFVFFKDFWSDLFFLGAMGFLVISLTILFVGKYVKVEKKFIWPVFYYALAIVAGLGVVKYAMSMETRPPRRSVMTILYEMGQILKGNISDDFGSSRIYAWKVGYRFFKEKPILGHGPDTIRDLWMIEEYKVSMERSNVIFDKLHNDYLQVLVTTGILGLVSYLTFQVSLFFRSFKKFDQPLVVALATTGLCFCGQAVFNIGVPIVSPYGWIIFGMLAALLVDHKERKIEE